MAKVGFESQADIQAQIEKLEPLQKRELLGRLVAELEGSQGDGLDEIWLKEAQRRFEELKSGSAQGVPAAQVFAKLEERLG